MSGHQRNWSLVCPGYRQQGFTLLELMVVLVLIGVVVSMTLMVKGRDGYDLAEEEARRLQVLMRLAGDESVLNNRELALEFHADGYRFLSYDPRSRAWQPFAGRSPFRPRCLPSLVAMEVEMGGDGPAVLDRMGCLNGRLASQDQAEEEDPERIFYRVLFLSSGEMTPFRITLPVADRDDEDFLLMGNLQGQVELYYPGEQDELI